MVHAMSAAVDWMRTRREEYLKLSLQHSKHLELRTVTDYRRPATVPVETDSNHTSPYLRNHS